MACNASLLLIGSELLDGRIREKNSHYTIAALNEAGFKVRHYLSCGDDLEEICAALEHLFRDSNVIITSGGLGPTSDDLTREAIAKFFSAELERDEETIEALRERYSKRGRELDKSNEKQAYFPTGADIIRNPKGTAPAFKLQSGDRRTYSLPGVPREFEYLLDNSVLPDLIKSYEPNILQQSTLRIFGLGESQINTMLSDVKINKDVELAYQFSFPEIDVVLSGHNEESLAEVTNSVRKAIRSKYIVSEERQSLPDVIAAALIKNKETLGLAESCTGGLVGDLITSIPGTSDCFLGGIVSYSNEVKIKSLGVAEDTIKNHGAVSAETAYEMAAGARKKLGADHSLSITGIAGPSGGSEEKPVGTFYVGYSSEKETISQHFFFPNERNMVRRYAAFCALEMLRRRLT